MQEGKGFGRFEIYAYMSISVYLYIYICIYVCIYDWRYYYFSGLVLGNIFIDLARFTRIYNDKDIQDFMQR